MTRWVALMPLRGGSKSIPGKNLRAIAGRPLFSWSLREAIASNCFDDVYVVTDSASIHRAVGELCPQAVVLDRSASVADATDTELVLEEFQARVSFDVVCLIQATSPWTQAEHFREAKARFEAAPWDSLLTVAPMKRFFWSADGQPLNYDPANRPRRQDLTGQLTENGAFYFTKADVLQRCRVRLGGKIGLYEMPATTLLEIDEAADWVAAEQLLLKQLAASIHKKGKHIRALVLDVDGTLTDGGMYYDATGEAMKKFDTRDAHGMLLLRDQGIHLAVITGEDSKAVAARMQKLRIDEYHPGIQDKLPVLRRLSCKWGIPLQHIAYMGDDLGDVQCLRHAGFSLCPANAVPAVRPLCHYQTTAAAGAGAVREACDLIMKWTSAGEESVAQP